MVVVDLKIPFRADSKVHLAMKSQLHQHVIEKADTRRNIATGASIEVQHDLDSGFGRFPINLRVTDARRLLAHAASYTFATGQDDGRLVYASAVSIKRNLKNVNDRIKTTCDSLARDPETITLIAVSKTHPIDEIKLAYDLGHRHFGESRLQEASPKIETLPADIVWHFIGPMQSNKAKKIGTLFGVVHTVCKRSHLIELNKLTRPVDALIEVNIAEESQKTGISPQQLDEFYSEALEFNQVHVRGLMTIGPVLSDAETIRPYFRAIAQRRIELGAEWLCMGMSEDFEVAIQEGASHIRVGTAIFGSRNV